MLQIVIPAAGRGSRFNNSEYTAPKPLIRFESKSMIEHVIENLNSENVKFYIITRFEHDLKRELSKYSNVTVIEINYYTDGPATTSYLVKNLLDPNEELIVTNCDQIIEDWDEKYFLELSRKYDTSLGCFYSDKPYNSYVKLDENGLVIDIKEKQVISNIATNGLHYWKKAKYFFKSYDEMILNKDSVNGEYYIAPSFNYILKDGLTIGIYMFNKHYPIGTPEDLKNYLNK